MIDETQDSLPASGASTSAGNEAGSTSGQSAGQSGAEVTEIVDPFDYAETIVRDLALHVGSRLKDFRADLATLHSAVVQLPETMRINAMAQSLDDVRDRLGHLTGVVGHNGSRSTDEFERISRLLTELVQRLTTIENWVATAGRSSQSEGPQTALPLPVGGLIGSQQFDRIIDHIHESIVRVVSAVREMQLDLRDLRADQRGMSRVSMPVALLAPPVTPAAPSSSSPSSSSTVLVADPAAPTVEDVGFSVGPDLAALVFAVWPQLVRPSGAEALRHAVDQVLSQMSPRLDELVRSPTVGKDAGLIAVGSVARPKGGDVVVLVATEDLGGFAWSLADGATEMSSEDALPTMRVPCFRALLAAATLVEQTQQEATVLPILIYGNGTMDRVPSRNEVLSQGQALGCSIAAGRLVQVAAQDLAGTLGLLRPGEALAALVTLLA